MTPAWACPACPRIKTLVGHVFVADINGAAVYVFVDNRRKLLHSKRVG
jgi:hypothetical protein